MAGTCWAEGPFDTVMTTVSPFFRVVSISGAWRITVPAGTVGWFTSITSS